MYLLADKHQELYRHYFTLLILCTFYALSYLDIKPFRLHILESNSRNCKKNIAFLSVHAFGCCIKRYNIQYTSCFSRSAISYSMSNPITNGTLNRNKTGTGYIKSERE